MGNVFGVQQRERRTSEKENKKICGGGASTFGRWASKEKTIVSGEAWVGFAYEGVVGLGSEKGRDQYVVE